MHLPERGAELDRVGAHRAAISVDPVVVTVKPDDGDAVEIVREALAKISVPAGAEVYMGGDIGRKRDLSSFWPLVKMPGLNLLTTPIVVRLKNQKFKKQREVVSLLMDTLGVRRHCQDSTGIGAQLAEELQDSYGEERIEKVDFTLAVKEDLAVRTKRLFEDRGIQIPDNRDITASIHAVKKFATAAGNFRFDAARTDAGHADDFWSLSLSALAASNPAQIGMANQAMPAGAFQPERQGIMSRVARDVAEVARTGIITGTSRREERRSTTPLKLTSSISPRRAPKR
jgi:phage FluMu gp28-like protein